MFSHPKPRQSDEESWRDSIQLPRFSFETAKSQRLLDPEDMFHDDDSPREAEGREKSIHRMLRNDDDDDDEDAEEIVSWDGPNDPEKPLNWSWKKKWLTTILMSMFTFISPFSSTMVTPVLQDIGDEFNISEGFLRQLVMTIFMLGFAQGPFVLGPLSEVFGRVKVLQLANCVYLIFNIACGFAQTQTQMLVFRLLSGIGGSAPQAVRNGVLADIWSKDERGKGQTIYGMLAFIGPCVAPICGAYISQSTSWRWIFWSTSIFDAIVQILALFWLSETYEPVLLIRKVNGIKKEEPGRRVRTEFDSKQRLSKVLRKRLTLPLIMMFTHPAVQITSLYRAYLYGLMYFVLSTFPFVWVDTYEFAKGPASLNYLSLCTGFVIGLLISEKLLDGLYARLKKKHNLTSGPPEWRVPPMLIGIVLCPLGLLLYGWPAQYRLHFIIPNIGAAILALGLIISFQCCQAYTVDAYSHHYAASAAAVSAFTRTMCGFSFPLFAPAMYARLGLGWGNSLLAFLTMGLAVLCPGVLWVWGKKIRQVSTRGLDVRLLEKD
ncbi:MFS multidrug transporter-like protein [Dendryphion nanum]|uniref:MFS multidrug transporter-like protein n=1 Tax=Dendryphion nanum TaxID=256645 RepID=A0A9P9DF11_9PLEO|nr:MFS multidrug transporter-like protein [Dendryphion nanum]